jgi:hypothetical protein
MPRVWMNIVPWNEAGEEQARLQAARRFRDDPQLEGFQSCDFGRPFVRLPDPSGEGAEAETVIGGTEANPNGMALLHPADLQLTCLARSVPATISGNGQKPGSALLLGDEEGRLFLVHPKDRRVTPI